MLGSWNKQHPEDPYKIAQAPGGNVARPFDREKMAHWAGKMILPAQFFGYKHPMNTSLSTARIDDAPQRLGFAVKVLGSGGLKANDARRWQSDPHLSVTIGYLHEIFAYLAKNQITMYRMSSDIAPYVTHPDMPQFWGQIQECSEALAALGKVARDHGIRLSMHPSQFIVLNSPDPVLVGKSTKDLLAAAEILDAMEMGPDAVLIIHVGGTYGDPKSGCERWVETYKTLPEPVRRRLVLENDDIRYSAADVLSIHDETGVPLVFDNLHFWCNNPEQLPITPTFYKFLATWQNARPKMHFSSPNTGMREVRRKDKTTNKLATFYQQPIWTGHADFIHPFEFIQFVRDAFSESTTPLFDVMLEAKSKDLALLRLRRDLPRYAPDVAARFGLSTAPDPDDTEYYEADPETGNETSGEMVE